MGRGVTEAIDLDDLPRACSPALSEKRVAAYVEAASLALDVHHTSPVTTTLDRVEGRELVQVVWSSTPDARASYDLREIAEDGATAVALAIATRQGLRVLKRLEQGTGADFLFLLASPGADDEDSVRLEVSGILSGSNPSDHRKVINRKLQQLGRGGDSSCIAIVVAFEPPTAYLRAGAA